MSQETVALLVGLVVGATLVLVGIAAGSYRARQIAEAADTLMGALYRRDEPYEQEREPEVVDAEVVAEPEPDDEPDEPMDMHPDIPPVWRTARVDRPDLHCSCHGNPVKAGDKMLWWTRPDNSVVLYCPDVVDDAAKQANLA